MRHVLVIDSTGNVVLGDVDKIVRMPIGRPLEPEQQSTVLCAAWSPVGQWTAWSVDSEGPDGVHELRLHDEDTDESWVLAESVRAFYLCPSPCGRWLSHLSPGPLGLELALSDVRTGELRIVERGQPMFWSWSPDSKHLAVHAANRVLIADLDGGAPRVLTEEAGPFVAPWWGSGGSVFYGLDDRLVAAAPDGSVATVVSRGSSGRFAPDPDGRRIAYVEVADGRGQLVVVDLLTGEQRAVTNSPIAGFFWSPDSARLAALVAAGDAQVQWLVFDGADTHSLAPFRPSNTWARSVLPFFEQYTQSHAQWSGDSTRLIAPAVDTAGASGALVQGVHPPYPTTWLPDAELVWWA